MRENGDLLLKDRTQVKYLCFCIKTKKKRWQKRKKVDAARKNLENFSVKTKETEVSRKKIFPFQILQGKLGRWIICSTSPTSRTFVRGEWIYFCICDLISDTWNNLLSHFRIWEVFRWVRFTWLYYWNQRVSYSIHFANNHAYQWLLKVSA